MTVEEIIQLHAHAKKRIYLQYKNRVDSTKKRWCYIEPDKDLIVAGLSATTGRTQWSANSTWPNFSIRLAEMQTHKDCDIVVSVLKERSNVQIFIKPELIFYHCERKGNISKVLYGK